MTRRERQGAILRLVSEREVSTQEELAGALQEAGVNVVQTTVSRDISELGLVKVRGHNSRLIYARPGAADRDRLSDFETALRRWAVTLESSGNLVIITTPSGYADPLAEAIDEAGHPPILGTIAGENTIVVVAREGVAGTALRDELRGYMTKGAA